MPLKLTSNLTDNKLDGVGSFWLDGQKIEISVFPNCAVTLERNGKVITLSKNNNTKTTIKGVVQLGDIYTIEKGFEKITVVVEEQKEFKPPEIFVSSDKFNEGTDQKRKTTLTVGAILLTLLVVSVGLGINQKKVTEIQKNGDIKFALASEKYEKSISQSIDKVEARDSFSESKKIAQELEVSGYKNDKLQELIDNLNKNEANVLGEIKVETSEFLDLTLQISGFSGTNMVSSGEEMFILDETKKDVIKVNIKTKNAKIVGNEDRVGDVISIGSYEDRFFVNRNDGIYEIDTIAKKKIERDWNDTELVYFYAGNAYLLDKDDNQIYRFAGSNQNFGSKSAWLAPGIEMDLSKTKDIVIDGSIWLLSETGKVTKLTNGNPVQITLKGITEQLEKPTAIYTNENNENVYILEKEKGRVVVITKTGEFKMQYIGESIKQADDLVVSEEEKKIILLGSSKLTYLELK